MITEEAINQLDDILKRLESLEARINNLEKERSNSTQSKKDLKWTITKSYVVNSGSKCTLRNFVRLSNGKMGYLMVISTSEGNYTIGQTRKIADMFGYKYDSKTKREMLGFELVSKYGDGEWAVIGKNAVDANGITYDIIETSIPYSPGFLKLATGQIKDSNGKSSLENRYTNKPLVIDSNWTPDEIAGKLLEFYYSLVRKKSK